MVQLTRGCDTIRTSPAYGNGHTIPHHKGCRCFIAQRPLSEPRIWPSSKIMRNDIREIKMRFRMPFRFPTLCVLLYSGGVFQMKTIIV